MLFFDDMVSGQHLTSLHHVVDVDEMKAFARQWDPLPIHIDEEAGKKAFGSLTAPGLYVLAIKQRLIHSMPKMSVIASLGYDEVRFHLPLRPGDSVVLRQECLDCRPSKSKPDRGVVALKFSLINQNNETVMSHLDTILVNRRFASN